MARSNAKKPNKPQGGSDEFSSPERPWWVKGERRNPDGTIEIDFPTGYLKLLYEAFGKEIKSGPPFRGEDFLHCRTRQAALMHLVLIEERQPPRDPMDAWDAVGLSHKAGLPVPPWAADLFARVEADRMQGRLSSVDVFFGFSNKGKMGKRIAPVHKKLLQQRNDMLCQDVWSWTLLGESVEEACWRVAGRFQREKKAAEMKGTKWDETAYHLEIVRSRSKEDSANEQARLASRIRQLFFQWKKANARLLNDPRFVESRKSHLESDPENFRSLYPAE